jgi:hypothetical protein
VVSFIWKRENFPDFLCMNAMHTLMFSHFIASKPGILQLLYDTCNQLPFLQASCSIVHNTKKRGNQIDARGINNMVFTKTGTNILEFLPSHINMA